MLSAIQGFVNRHRRGLAVTAGVTGGIYLMGKYAKSKLIEFQEKTASQRTAEENMKRRFEQNQQDCVFTVLSLLPTLGDQLLHELHVELITAKLNQGRSQRSTPVPTPDGSVILTPKPAETSVFAIATAATENGEEGELKEDKEGEDGSEKKDDQESTIENHTTQESEDKPEANGTSEEHKTNGVLVNGDSKAESDTEKEKEEKEKEEKEKEEKEKEEKEKEEKEKEENSQEGSVVNGSAPEIKIEQESAEPQTTNNAEETAAEVQNTTQTAVKDEVAATIDRRTKLELWSELKIMTFTRTITALYSLTFLTLLTQIQLNLLGRFTYVSSVIALSNTTDASYRVESPAVKGSLTSTNGLLDFQTEKKYLTFSYWLLHEGWRRWSEKVREVIEEVVGGISLKRSLNAKEFSDLLGEIRARLEYTEVDGKRVPVNVREYMLPDEPEEEREVLRAGGVDEFDLVVDSVLRSLLDETRDFIDSEDFSMVLSSGLATTFARFNLSLQPTFNPFLLGGGGSAIEEIENDDDIDRSVPLITLLPLITRQVHLIINGVPNEYVDSLSMVKELQAFSAIVYSSFNERLVHN